MLLFFNDKIIIGPFVTRLHPSTCEPGPSPLGLKFAFHLLAVVVVAVDVHATVAKAPTGTIIHGR